MDRAESQTSELIVERVGSLGVMTLNRPEALNSLTLAMVRAMRASLDAFENDDRIGAVLLKGAGTRGLCAGGDIRGLLKSIKAADGYAQTFMREEYELDSYIGSYTKPYIAVMNGIVMGGGVGVSAHGSHRIATETTRLAMPEVGVGFLPDVGATFILSRTPSHFGTYLALTGEAVDGAGAKFAGFVDCVVPQDRIEALERDLSRLPPDAGHAAISETIARFTKGDAKPETVKAFAGCADAFARPTVEDIVRVLAANGSAFAMDTRNTILTRSPTSLKVTLALLRDAATASLEACLTAEYRATLAMFEGHDFLEGVRAAVIDKDRDPKWLPADLESVDDSVVQRHRRVRANEPQFDGRNKNR